MKIKFKLTLYYPIFISLILLVACTTKKQDKNPKINPLLGDGFGLNSATIIVKNLNKARNYFSDTLGFSMPPAARFENGIYDNTRTASIFFADFSTFDLMANIDSVSKLTKKPIESAFLKQNKSLAIYSFSTSSADTTKKRLQLRGFKTDSIRKGRSRIQIAKGWDWDDGGPQWRSVEFDSKNTQAHLPSFIEYTGLPYKDIQDEWKPAAWQKYYEKNPNGVVSISALRIVVSDLEAASNEFEKMGLRKLESNESFARFKIAPNQELYITTPKSPTDELSKILKSR